MDKKNILILIAYYLPGYKIGGPLTSILNIVNNLAGEFSFKILTSDRDFGDNKPYSGDLSGKWNSNGNSDIYYVRRNPFIIFSLLWQVKKNYKDILYINSFFDPIFSIVIMIAIKMRIIKVENIIIAPRGELFTEAINFKKGKKALYLWFANKFKLYEDVIWHASTIQEKDNIVKMMKVKPNTVHVAINMSSVSNDTSTVVESQVSDEERPLRLVFLGRISKDKNIAFTFQILKEIREEVVFDIYGPIEEPNLWDTCLETIKTLPDNIGVTYCGSLSRNDVKVTLGTYDLLFLPTFAENFGHVIAESLSVGTPVLISDNTPWRDLERDNLGWDLSLTRPDLFIEVIQQLARNTTRSKSRESIRETFINRLSNPEIINSNRKLFTLPFLKL